MAEQEPAIGIDLGTTFSCVAYFRNGNVEVIANEQGNRTTPSYVAFTDTERLIGQAAKDQAGINPQNTVFDAKRLIGRKFNDPAVQDDIINWPFKVDDVDGNPQIELNVKGEKKSFPPEQISGFILEKMKKIAEDFLGQKVTKAVVTVPAYFNDSQRQATKAAGRLAELEVLRIINEPTAAGIAFGYKNKFIEEKHVLVFDLGGGTFDVSILTIGNEVYEVKATAGDTHLGGEDFDNNVLNYFLEEIRRKHNKDLRNDKKAKFRLRVACEKAKRNLVNNSSADVTVDALFDGIDFKSKITQARFNELNAELFEKIKTPLEKALEDAHMEKEAIDSVVLVGGSSRIRRVEDMIKGIFKKKEVNRNINPDEAVAYGAAVLAAYLNGDRDKSLENFSLKDVISSSLGLEMVGGQMEVLIPRNTSIPTNASQVITTHFDNQSAISVIVYEGERPFVKENNRLGEFNITGIHPSQREVPKIEVTFSVNKDGILEVSAVDKRGGMEPQKKIIESKNGRLSESDIRKMIQDVLTFQEDDEKEAARIKARLALEDYCLEARSKVAFAKTMAQKDKDTIKKVCDDMLEWIEDNEDETEEAYEENTRNLKIKCDPVLARI